ncbi:hypothetical protein EG68_07923 [Paragonimus skrjabini miyazakii]|uniref:Ubiquitin-like domain-containing protein n=1 Tax=Paragonimus skrjabini miyazakii TaxID=59628 RepID=A0A8S9YK96_9TREM|nr:hypothetical protein EG68_07923 [Paragonimus skrjabini miyazakii]
MMNLKVKPLSKPEKSVQVLNSATVSDLLEAVQNSFNVDSACQRLVFKGCPLLDKLKTLDEYGIKDGDKLTLILKSTPIRQVQQRNFESLLRARLSTVYTEEEVDSIVSKFMHILSARINSMSLDDVERLAEIWLQTDG